MQLPTDVQAFAATASASTKWQGARFRFDSLPSQVGMDLVPLQTMAESTLSAHGLIRDDTRARYVVQVAASVRTAWVDDGWDPYPIYPGMRPWGTWGWGVGYGFSPSFWGGSHFPPRSTYWRELRLAILDGQTQQTVYETRARSETPSRAHDAIFATMLKASLQDFPNATAGWQLVNMELPAASPAAEPASAPIGAESSKAKGP